MTILRSIGERMNEATSLNNRGHVYLSMQQYKDALPLFEESLQICVEGQPKFEALPGVYKGRKAVRIGQPIVRADAAVEEKLRFEQKRV